MRSSPCFSAHLIALLSIGLVPHVTHAAWQLDGNPVCTAAGEQDDVNGVPDGSGGTILVWRDTRRGANLFDLRAARLLANGSLAPGWAVNGAAVAATGGAGYPFAAADGANGLFVAWFDNSTYSGRLQHLDASGAIAAGFGANGNALPVTIGGPGGFHLRLAPDGAGGLYLMWNEYTGTYDALRVTRLTSAGAVAPGWTAAGVVVGGGSFSTGWSQLDMRPDPAGGVLCAEVITVEDEPSGSSSIGRLRRVSPTGTITFSALLQPDGSQPVPGSHRVVGQVSFLPDGSGGGFAAWRVNTTPTAANHGQHYGSAGAALWPVGTSLPVIERIFSDGAGGFYVLGTPIGGPGLELHRRAADGSTPAGWATGAPVTPTGSYAAYAGSCAPTTAYACWSGGAVGSESVFASAFTPAGTLAPGWTSGGNAICTATGTQTLAAVLPGTGDDAYVAWVDRRAGNADVYALRLTPAGPAYLAAPGPSPGARLALGTPWPNPARERVLLAFTLPATAPASLELLDLSGRRVREVSLSPESGQRSWSLATEGLPDGVYFVRLRQGGQAVMRRVSVLR